MNRLLAAMALFLMASASNAQTFSVSGTVSLPEGVNAPATGTDITISTDPLESFAVGGGQLESSINVRIAPDTQSTSYALTLKDDPLINPGQTSLPPGLKKLRFSCDDGCDSLGVSNQGFWSEIDGVVGEADATTYTATQNHAVDIRLSRSDSFSGIIQLPEGLAANGGETIVLTLRSSSFSNPTSFAQTINMAEGEDEWPFFITVPQLDGVGGWTMELSCMACGEGVSGETHFPTTKAGDPMTLESNEGFFFVKFSSAINMQMTFIATRNNVLSIIGSIQLLLLDD